VRVTTLLNKLLNLQGLWVQGFEFDENDDLVLFVKARQRRATCPRCGTSVSIKRAGKLRRWRHLGIWGRIVWIEASIRRFRCRPCDATVTELVPWARHDSDFTRPFEDAVGLMAQKTDQTTVSTLFGISWITVGKIAQRLVGELLDPDRLSNLRRIGIDEISFRKHHRYLTVVTNHDTRRVVWVAEGKSSEVLKGFFRSLTQETRDAIEIVTMDMSGAYEKAVREDLPNAQIAFDHFHIAQLANEALNEVRRATVRELRTDDPERAKEIKGLRWTTLYTFDNLPAKHYPSLELLDPELPLGQAYLLKEQLLHLLRRPPHFKPRLLEWIVAAKESAIQPFVRLGNTLCHHIAGVFAFMDNLVSNARAEGINNKIRLLSHRAFGFHSAAPLIATIFLCCGGITLPQASHLL
jgi:transposase